MESLPRTRLLLLLLVVDATTFFHSPLPEEVAVETKDPSESNGFAETPMPMPPPLLPVAVVVVAPLLPPREAAADDNDEDDNGAAGAAANGSNRLLNGGFDMESPISREILLLHTPNSTPNN